MPTRLADVVETSDRVVAVASRRAKIGALAGFLRRLDVGEIEIGVGYLAGVLRQGRTGIGYAMLRDAEPDAPAVDATLTLSDVDACLATIADTRGAGSAAARATRLRDLLSRATTAERSFLARLILGELRQGALEGLMVDAVAAASNVPADEVRRAAMVAGGIAPVAERAMTEGREGLARYRLTLLAPLAPMLAQPAEDVASALEGIADPVIEWKVDGARVQIHRDADAVRIFSRTGNDVTAAAPEIVDAVLALPLRSVIADGEAIALKPDGAPYPFQETMSRFGRVQNVDALRQSMPLSVLVFDCLHADGKDLLAQPAQRRLAALDAAFPPSMRMPRIASRDIVAVRAFNDDALARGHEGVMVKDASALYAPGARSAAWRKVKRVHTLDLVVLAAEWGHGRRRGWLSNLHLGARDPATGTFVMLGKTFKGMTDEALRWQTEALGRIATTNEGHVVHVKPELVVEVAFNDLQASVRYPGGLALRFARIKGYRPDKRAEDADTLDTVRAIYAGQQR